MRGEAEYCIHSAAHPAYSTSSAMAASRAPAPPTTASALASSTTGAAGTPCICAPHVRVHSPSLSPAEARQRARRPAGARSVPDLQTLYMFKGQAAREALRAQAAQQRQTAIAFPDLTTHQPSTALPAPHQLPAGRSSSTCPQEEQTCSRGVPECAGWGGGRARRDGGDERCKRGQRLQAGARARRQRVGERQARTCGRCKRHRRQQHRRHRRHAQLMAHLARSAGAGRHPCGQPCSSARVPARLKERRCRDGQLGALPRPAPWHPSSVHASRTCRPRAPQLRAR